MIGSIVIDFTMAEGAVLRMLGLVERRGFEVRGISMDEEDGNGSLSLKVRARDDSRRLDVIAVQLKRLNEVRNVSYSTPASGHMQ